MFTLEVPCGLHASTAVDVDAFIARLGDLPASVWPAPSDASSSYATARARLDTVLTEQGLVVVAWYVRDLVQTSAFLAAQLTNVGLRPSGARDAQRRQAREIAEAAALALLVRPLLAAADFNALYAPFAFVLPRESLVRSRAARGSRHAVASIPRWD